MASPPFVIINLCPDCGGSGEYVGLNDVEQCRACGGSGRGNSPTFDDRLKTLAAKFRAAPSPRRPLFSICLTSTAGITTGGRFTFHQNGQDFRFQCTNRDSHGTVAIDLDPLTGGAVLIHPGDTLQVWPGNRLISVRLEDGPATPVNPRIKIDLDFTDTGDVISYNGNSRNFKFTCVGRFSATSRGTGKLFKFPHLQTNPTVAIAEEEEITIADDGTVHVFHLDGTSTRYNR